MSGNQGLKGHLLKNVQIPKYDGRKSFRMWEKTVKEILSLTGTEYADWCMFARLALEGYAADFVYNHDPERQWDFNMLMSSLAAEFEISDSALTTLSFFDIVQRDKESVTAFIRRLETSYAMYFPTEPRTPGGRYDSDMRAQIVKGLQPEVRRSCTTTLMETNLEVLKSKLRSFELLSGLNEGKTYRRNLSGETAQQRLATGKSQSATSQQQIRPILKKPAPKANVT